MIATHLSSAFAARSMACVATISCNFSMQAVTLFDAASWAAACLASIGHPADVFNDAFVVALSAELP
jgi:hypothetical protein